jgi:hypothetical protein
MNGGSVTSRARPEGSLKQKFQIRYEGVHGKLISYWAGLSELKPYMLPGWFSVWERGETGEDVLSILSPALIEGYRNLVSREGSR